ncbi:hypothetical protein [Maridesulfovibrio sp. FT414]|uniref:hypothetical protein n=1 Tax=Maridesulfovibrio sp. FT414 TaxID=2979469 RepID=UPI003D8026D1
MGYDCRRSSITGSDCRDSSKRGKDFVKDAGRKADIKIKNISAKATKNKFEIDSNDVADGATALIEGLPPSNGKISGPVTAIMGAKDAIENGRQAYKDITQKNNEKNNKK